MDRRTIYIHKKYAGDWRKVPLHVIANNLAKKHKLPFRFRMCHGRHVNLKERLIADCTKKIFADVIYMPTDRENHTFDQKNASKYHQCACRSPKVEGKCMFDGKCKTEAIIYNVLWVPTGHNYIGKSQGNLAHRINRGHVNDLVAFYNVRVNYKHYIAKDEVINIAKTPKGKPRRYSTVVTPEYSQELTQTPNQTGISALVELIKARLTPNQNLYSSDETDDETTMSQSEDKSLDERLSQPLTPKTAFQAAFGRPTEKRSPKPK